ncbi:MAG: CO2 hydration protein [Tychonema bourrellyi B0820]|uniref:CO2 hydration protein n=1 Tax=Tychonema bourrellyi FEM_GT703 TaxID=2040638 RepID=A0A2G4EZI1_9CYAN|nr:CO2 hydration protein [Tychonema bourrellyi]MDQ2098452.1 CO2 hydration protein [Tychonema bourrellyi B0820]PHX54921.1 CO2 hydration protein [Tychonema bourrellyi FEM_GT703]
MKNTILKPSSHPLAEYIDLLESGKALLPESDENVVEVIGVLKSYAIVLDAYSRNLNYIAESQFLVLFPFFKYFNGEVTLPKLMRYLWHDRINFEYAEYCMKTMLWHGGGGLDSYLDSPEFDNLVEKAIAAKLKGNIFMQGLHKVFPNFLPEQVRMLAYYTGLGQFWRVMSDLFMDLSDSYDRKETKSIADVVDFVKAGLVAAASLPITYSVKISDRVYDIIPAAANLTFLPDVAVPYVESIFFRGTAFFGTVSYNAQAHQIPAEQRDFTYGALFADPLPIGGAGIPPTQLMQDMRHYLPEYLHEVYRTSCRGEDDVRVQICQSFQKSMFCVTTATILGLAPHPINTSDSDEKKANRVYLEGWMDRFGNSRLNWANQPTNRSCQLFPER